MTLFIAVRSPDYCRDARAQLMQAALFKVILFMSLCLKLCERSLFISLKINFLILQNFSISNTKRLYNKTMPKLVIKTSFRNSHLSRPIFYDYVKAVPCRIRRLDLERKYFSYCRVSGERKIETFLPASTNPSSEHDASLLLDQERRKNIP